MLGPVRLQNRKQLGLVDLDFLHSVPPIMNPKILPHDPFKRLSILALTFSRDGFGNDKGGSGREPTNHDGL